MKLFLDNSENGFTLVEVLVALFIIALIIMGGGMFFFYGRVNIIREAHRRAAVLVASQRLEELKGADYSGIGSSGPEPVDVDNLSGDSPTGPTMDTVVEFVDDGGINEAYKKVTVTVNWVDSRSNSVSATTLIAPR